MDKLKPCPFCGFENLEIYNEIVNEDDFYFIECSKCHSSSPKCRMEIHAIQVWNSRVTTGFNQIQALKLTIDYLQKKLEELINE